MGGQDVPVAQVSRKAEKCRLEIHRAYAEAFIHNDCESRAALQGEDVGVGKLASDRRVTRVGALLRKATMDELHIFRRHQRAI